jgi:hypothetical protein
MGVLGLMEPWPGATDCCTVVGQEKKEIIRRVVGKVVVDGQSRRVRVLVRRFPKGGDPADRLIEEVEKAGTASENQMPFRNIVVPGTGNVRYSHT